MAPEIGTTTVIISRELESLSREKSHQGGLLSESPDLEQVTSLRFSFHICQIKQLASTDDPQAFFHFGESQIQSNEVVAHSLEMSLPQANSKSAPPPPGVY